MSGFVPFDKLSKKKKEEDNKKRRRTWGAVSPVTRKPPNPKAYDRKKEKTVYTQLDEMKQRGFTDEND